MGAEAPGLAKIGTTRQQGKDTGYWPLIDEEPEQFDGRGIDPMQVSQNKEHRLLGGQRHQHGQERFQGLLFLLLRGQAERRVAIDKRHGEQRGQQRHYTPLGRGRESCARALSNFSSFTSEESSLLNCSTRWYRSMTG